MRPEPMVKAEEPAPWASVPQYNRPAVVDLTSQSFALREAMVVEPLAAIWNRLRPEEEATVNRGIVGEEDVPTTDSTAGGVGEPMPMRPSEGLAEPAAPLNKPVPNRTLPMFNCWLPVE